MPDASMLWPQLLETVMLICFGLSWPISIHKSWRTRNVAGKSRVFLSFVFLGYVAGATAKLWRAHILGARPEWVTALYAFNGMLVLVDIILHRKITREGQVA